MVPWQDAARIGISQRSRSIQNKVRSWAIPRDSASVGRVPETGAGRVGCVERERPVWPTHTVHLRRRPRVGRGARGGWCAALAAAAVRRGCM